MLNFSKLIITFIVTTSLVFALGLSVPNGEVGSSDIKIIENQSWVASKQLNEMQLKKIIKKYENFRVIQYDSLYGLLIEYDHTDQSTLEDLEKLKMEPGVFRVFNRVYEGKDAFIIYK